MTQPESRLSKRILDALRGEGWFAYKNHGGPYMMAGLPDIVVCAEGRYVGLETKMPDKRGNVSPRQVLVLQQIRDHGGVAEVVCSPVEAVEVVRRALDG